MPSFNAGELYDALKAEIVATAAITSLLRTAPTGFGGGPAVYRDGRAPQPSQVQPMSGLVPWIVIGGATAVSDSTFALHGWNSTVQVKPVVQGAEDDAQDIVQALSELFFPDGRPKALTLPRFTSCWVDEFTPQPALTEQISGVTTVSVPVILRVRLS